MTGRCYDNVAQLTACQVSAYPHQGAGGRPKLNAYRHNSLFGVLLFAALGPGRLYRIGEECPSRNQLKELSGIVSFLFGRKPPIKDDLIF